MCLCVYARVRLRGWWGGGGGGGRRFELAFVRDGEFGCESVGVDVSVDARAFVCCVGVYEYVHVFGCVAA